MEFIISLLTLTALEIVLGIDNVIFITILAGRLPQERQHWARRMGLGAALISRVILLLCITWVMKLESDWFTIMDQGISGKDLILIIGGLFLIGKATVEIRANVDGAHGSEDEGEGGDQKLLDPAHMIRSFLIQVIILDVVFSLDSVITAVGMVGDLTVMICAVLAAVAVMMVFSGPIGDFVQRHASIRILALSFLVLIGVLLLAEGFGQHVSKGYVYFAMAFSLGVELLNMRMRTRADLFNNLKRAQQKSAQHTAVGH
jgi:predicted tellurium resistance membrane protein TerC